MARQDEVGSTRVDSRGGVPEQWSEPALSGGPVVTERQGGGSRWDRLRWGPIWAGALVVLMTFVVLQLLFFALGWLDLGFDGPNSAVVASVVSGFLALVAFFVGGLTAGASTTWRGSKKDGIMLGVLVWALSEALILVLAFFGGGALLGPLSEIATQATGSTPQSVNAAQLLDTVRQSAGWTVLFLGLAVFAAALGGGMGKRKAPTDVR